MSRILLKSNVEGLHFHDFMLFKLLIQVYGEDKLIKLLNRIKELGGINEVVGFKG